MGGEMSKKAASYDTKELFLRGIIAFGRTLGLFANPMQAAPEQIHRTKDEDQKRRKSHAKFKAQCAARKNQRRLAA